MDTRLQQPTLELRNVTKSYGTRNVVDGVALTLRPGTITGLVGVNGSGKTTLFKVIAGLLKPASGTIDLVYDSRNRVSLLPLSADRRVRLGLHYQGQERRLLSRLSSLNNLKIAKRSTGEQPDAAAIIGRLEELRLTNLLARWSGELKRPEIVLLLLAKAYVLESRFLFIDEPFANMDRRGVFHCIAIMIKLREQGACITVSDHHANTILEFVDDICIMRHGSIAFLDTTAAARSSLEAKRLYFGPNA
ncbi:MAG TPA: ATP-binding cassette domain-containing protein [Candidatus Cybelea sp.]|jgi:ABC-type lipopolysaccharide export system ATPase subunit